jgi:hypothetical protein
VSDRLTIELVPETAWFRNLRSEISGEAWDKIRKDCYKNAGYVCEICGGVGQRHPVECHEIWEYDDGDKRQILRGVIALCPSCHEVKHIGLTQMRGGLDRAVSHMAEVNGWGNDGHGASVARMKKGEKIRGLAGTESAYVGHRHRLAL